MGTSRHAATPRPHWRLLNWLRDVENTGQRGRIVTAVNSQDADYDDLSALEDHGWVQYLLPTDTGNVELRWADIRANVFITLTGLMTLTTGGSAKLNDPTNRVLRALHPHRYRPGRATQVDTIRTAADVDDTTLIDIADRDLITAAADGVDLTAFHRLPAKLPLRLTPAGQSCLRSGVISTSDGRFLI